MDYEHALEKKKRAPNYTLREKEYLLSVVMKYKNIIENKKNDAVTCKEKKDAWLKICEEFNCASPNLCNRAVESLKKLYDKMKEDLRKRSAENRKNLYKTGGGDSTAITEPGDSLLLSLINEKCVVGLDAPYDSDGVGVPFRKKEVHCDKNLEIVNIEQEAPNENENDIQIIYEDDIDKHTSAFSKENLHEEVRKDSDNPKTQEASAKKVMSGVLKENIKETYLKKQTVPQKLSRRRPAPVIKTLTSSKLGEKYELLIEKKLDLLKCYKQEHYLRVHLLKLDIAIKKRQLLSLSFPNSKNDGPGSALDSSLNEILNMDQSILDDPAID